MQTLLVLLSALSAPGEDTPAPDISSVGADLAVPEVTEGEPAPGLRVRQTTPGYQHTETYHALYLPPEWKPGGGPYPVIVEYTGNRYGPGPCGDICTGRLEDAKLGYGISGGNGFIWVSMPFLNGAGTANVRTWWGDPGKYQTGPTIDYCIRTVRFVCAQYGGDPEAVVLAGFSRGSIACNYIGLHNDEIARLWRAFVPYANYDGLNPGWPYPECDEASAFQRLQRLRGRPQFICQEVLPPEDEDISLNAIRELVEDSGVAAPFTFMLTGFRNHNDAWILRPSPARRALRAWLKACLAR